MLQGWLLCAFINGFCPNCCQWPLATNRCDSPLADTFDARTSPTTQFCPAVHARLRSVDSMSMYVYVGVIRALACPPPTHPVVAIHATFQAAQSRFDHKESSGKFDSAGL